MARGKRSLVHAVRIFLRNHSTLAALTVIAALALRVLVPGGYMPTLDHGKIVVAICNGAPGGSGTMVMAVPGKDHAQSSGDIARGKCAYADLAQAMTGGADPILLAMALAFTLALALRRISAMPVRSAAYLRPPLRGPPVRA